MVPVVRVIERPRAPRRVGAKRVLCAGLACAVLASTTWLFGRTSAASVVVPVALAQAPSDALRAPERPALAQEASVPEADQEPPSTPTPARTHARHRKPRHHKRAWRAHARSATPLGG
jgi:hypothetical protein